jgi:hypothetical protein
MRASQARPVSQVSARPGLQDSQVLPDSPGALASRACKALQGQLGRQEMQG